MMKSQRNIAVILALSGLIFIYLSGWFVPLAPGWLVWLGWILVACGVRTFHARWFWATSAVWNLWVTLVLFAFSTWAPKMETAIFWFSRIHSIAATFLSLLCLYMLHREIGPARALKEEIQK